MRLPAVVSWSGGKDSVLALDALRRSRDFEPCALLTSVAAGYDRVSIHGVRRSLLERQAATLGMPLFTMELPASCSNAEYEAEFAAALTRLREALPDAAHVAFGDLFLEDVRAYRERLVAENGWAPLFPLWGSDTSELARAFVARGFAARVVCVDTTVLDARFAGRAFDAALLAGLPRSVDPCGERGEFHTFVTDGPGFASAVGYAVGEVVMREERFAYCDLLEAVPGGASPVGAFSRA